LSTEQGPATDKTTASNHSDLPERAQQPGYNLQHNVTELKPKHRFKLTGSGVEYLENIQWLDRWPDPLKAGVAKLPFGEVRPRRGLYYKEKYPSIRLLLCNSQWEF
jgi:hypothetical protein